MSISLKITRFLSKTPKSILFRKNIDIHEKSKVSVLFFYCILLSEHCLIIANYL